MTDITTWATATAEDGRRTGPEKAVAKRLLDIVNGMRGRIEVLEAREQSLQTQMDSSARERADLEAVLADLCGPLEPAAAPAVAKPGRTRKAKAQPTDPMPEQTADFALVIPAALDRRAAE